MTQSQSQRNFTLLLITFLCACNGFLVEANITQTIAASLGGTLLQYQLGIGLFVFSLGLGSLLYPKLNDRYGHRNLLLFSTGGLASLAIIGPYCAYWVGDTLNLTLGNPLSLLVYIPLIVVGLITGLDLPILIFLGREKNHLSESKILGIDYFGMFIGCLTFPFLFQYAGIFQTTWVCLLLSLVTFLLVVSLAKVSPREEQHKRKWPPLNTFMALSFLFSFCSLSYELLLARWLVDFFDNEVFAMTFAIGFYLMGLAFGSFLIKPKNWGLQLVKIETVLIVSVLTIPFLGYFFATLWKSYWQSPESLLALQTLFLLFIGWVGFLSGHELPLLMKSQQKKHELAWPALLFWNYLGALTASLALSFLLLPNLGLYPSLALVVSINVLSLFLVKFVTLIKHCYLLIGMGVITTAILIMPSTTTLWEQIFLKVTYNKITVAELSPRTLKSYLKLNRDLSDIRRITTPYQNIDLVRTEIPGAGTGFNDLHMYLNRQPQFSLYYHDLYHDSFSVGALNLHGEVPKKVLLLGGGDGLLANKLRQIPGVNRIVLVELDKQMIELARSHWRLSKANRQVFDSEKIEIVTQDAFSWLKSNNESFEAIFVDFPYPTNYELSRLYSKEFYIKVEESLSQDGFMIMNAPISFRFESSSTTHLEATSTLINTLKVAGFQCVLPFGSKEPFLYIEKEERKLAFNYQKLPKDFPNSSFINLVPIKEVVDLPPSTKVNSVYKPSQVVSW